jgi:hypothetical protein
MTALELPSPPLAGARRRPAVLRALAWAEARRTLRNPVLWIGAGLSVAMVWTTAPEAGEWPGASYEQMMLTSVPLMFAISVVVAVSFHRERVPLAPAAPVGEGGRTLARLLAAVPLVVLATVFTVAVAVRERRLGGLWLGTEPGRTTDALHTAGELAQNVALALVAVAVGAALGRRLSRLVSVVPLLFVLWFLVSVYWLFGDRRVTPFSLLQVQPVRVEVGPASADPLTFPTDWLLEGPGDYSSVWARVFVSDALGWWHVVWLLGVAAVVLGAAVPRGPARRALLLAGPVVAAVGVVGQVVVIP